VDLAGLARSVQVATSVPQGASLDQRDVKFLEDSFVAVQAELGMMLAELARTSQSRRNIPGDDNNSCHKCSHAKI
jgi:hypothetical protein